MCVCVCVCVSESRVGIRYRVLKALIRSPQEGGEEFAKVVALA